MSTSADRQDNFVTGINNAGFITGYALMGPGPLHYAGFVMDGHGKLLIIQPSTIGASYTDIEIQGINDSNVIVVRAMTGDQSDIYKGYYEGYNLSKPDSFTFKKVTGNQEPGLAIPYGINNRNDITGWYKGGTTKWFFIIHDSLPVNGSTWDARRYTQNKVYYNTLGTNTNNNGVTCGFWEDGSTYAPFIYDNIAKSYTTLNTSFRMKLWGINDSDVLVGEFERTNGYNQGFWGKVLPSGTIQVHSLHSIFLNDSIASVARAINQKGEIVGSFLHPKTGKWVGFIYRPNQNEYRLPGFSFAQDRWSLLNSDSNSIGVWTKNYYQNFSYYKSDPYANVNIPVMDSFIIHTIHLKHVDSSFTPSYLGIAEEADIRGIGTSTNPVDQMKYQHFLKPRFVTKMFKYGDTAFHGYCSGFSYSALHRFINPAEFSLWSGLPANISLPQIPNTYFAAIKTIERYFLKQFEPALSFAIGGPGYVMPMYEGLYRMKMDFNTSYAACNPTDLGLYFPSGGGHSVLPYKIHTPKILPFDYPTAVKDTIYIYDSNAPKDSTRIFLVPNWSMSFATSQAWSPWYGSINLAFNEPGVRDLITDIKKHSALKPGSRNGRTPLADVVMADDSMLSISLGGTKLYYGIQGPASSAATLNAAGFVNTISNLFPVKAREISDSIPNSFLTDSLNRFSFSTYHYTDSVMNWSAATSVTRMMGISRDALPGESDNGFVAAHQIAYGTHDNVTKNLSGYLNESDPTLSKGANILVRNLIVNSGDSILTENPAPYTYRVTRIGGASSAKYDLWLYVIMPDSVKEFRKEQITIDPNTSHVITPYFQGPHGPQVAVLVDHGNTGHVTDTLFVGASSGVPDNVSSGSIRISPNPVTDMLNISFSDQQADAYKITVTDVDGRTIDTRDTPPNSQKLEIPTSLYRAGIYFVWITDRNGKQIFTQKFLK